MANNRRNRSEFSSKIRDLTARRAGFKCSFPGCDRITIGPAKDAHKSSNNGIAAHIYSAATSGGGPRGSGGLSEEELKSPQNAIWLCGNHASLIDKHGGEEYPPERLHSYKTLHETRIAHELTGIHTPLGWVNNVRIHSSPLFDETVEIDFAKLTLLLGQGSVGKTALCEWIAAHVDAQYLERWAKIIPDDWKRVSAELSYLNPEPHLTSACFLSEDCPKYKLDGKFTAIPATPLRIVFPGEIQFPYQEEANDLELVSEALNLHPYEVLALCEDMASNGSDYVKRAWFEEGDEGCHLFAEVQSIRPSRPRLFRLLSGSERARVLMEFGILAANRLAIMHPTLLILDSGFCRLDNDWLRCYAEFLGSPTRKFQTIASIRSEEVNLSDLKWAGWKIVRFDGTPPNVVIRSGVLEEKS